jgi:putative ABC transport system ATP-binding protein
MTPILIAKKIQVIVDDRVAPILFETNLSIEEEDFVVILGVNGSGKSTLIKLLSGARRPSSGEILVGGISLPKMDSRLKAIDLVTISQKADDRLFIELTLEENIILWENRFPSLERMLPEQVLKANKAERFLPLLKQKMGDFSGGEKQMILLKLALAHPPKILFLDEHTSSLDPRAANEVMHATAKAISEHKITTVMVTHRLEDALHYGSRFIVMRDGAIVWDGKRSDGLSAPQLREVMEG